MPLQRQRFRLRHHRGQRAGAQQGRNLASGRVDAMQIVQSHILLRSYPGPRRRRGRCYLPRLPSHQKLYFALTPQVRGSPA